MRFYCSKLVDTDCESVENIYLGDKNENKVYLFTKTEENKLRPASGILLELLDSWDETSRQQVYRVNVISKYCSKGDELCKLDTQGIFLQWKRKGLAILGTKTRRGFSK